MASAAGEQPKSQAKIKAIIGGMVGLLLLVWVFSRLDFSKIPAIIADIHPSWYLAAVLIKLSVIFIKGLRLRLALSFTLNRTSKRAIPAVFIGYFGNAVFPFKLGELAKLDILRRHNRVPFTQILAVLIFERTLDLAILLCFLGLVIPFVTLPDWASTGAIPIAGVTLVLILGTLIAAKNQVMVPSWLMPGSFGRRLGAWLNSKVASFSKGLTIVNSPITTLSCAGLTITGWAFEVLSSYLMLVAFGIILPWYVPLLLTVIVTLGIALPSSPSGIGTHQFLWMIILGTYGVTEEKAVSVSILIVITMVSLLTVIGSVLTWREGMSLNLRKSFKREPNGVVG